ncbi:MAG: DMT family transporter [Thermodesulfobacteriota bacterium]|nr:DMT family transporter [Thermodesulfobacteriota bacterium]
MQTAIYIGLAFLMGTSMSIYLPMNSSMSKYVGSSITANVIFFSVGLVTSMLILVLFGETDTLARTRDVPIHLFLTGFLSAFIVLGATFLIPHIGARIFFILLVTGQVLMAVAVSHFGILESPMDPIGIKKLIGAALVITGAIISAG